MLEDDVKCLHQLAARGLWRWNHKNNYGKVAFSMSHMESSQNNKEAKDIQAQVQEDTK